MSNFKDLTGQRFGKLVAVEMADDYVSPKNGKKSRQWLCKCDCGNDIIVRGSYLRSGQKTSCGCVTTSWNPLFVYIEKELMGYEEGKVLSKSQVLRVKGLQNGKYMANNNTDGRGDYSYDVIFNTFKYCKESILKAFKYKTFKDESHKFNYMIRIVEENLNTVCKRMEQAKRVKEEVERAEVIIPARNVEYVPKKKKNDRFADLWV